MELLNKDLKNLLIQLEIQKEIQELKELGLTSIEIEGYIEFYWDNWYPPLKIKELN